VTHIDPITRANVNPEFAHAATDRFDVARIAGDDPIDSQSNCGARDRIL